MNYQQLTEAQRYQMVSYLKADFSQTKPVKALGVSKSTLSRELQPNGKRQSYNATYVITVSKERRK